MTEVRDAYDTPWKDVVEIYFEDFLRFFFPAIHADIDWSKGYEFLDKELSQIVRDAELGTRYADKLVKVWKRSGEETWVMLHLEIQSQEDGTFSERMFLYYYRLRDKYKREVVSLAVLGDDRATWRPQTFERSLWGCEVMFRFPIIKLLDYESRWAELEASRNPFAIVVMSHLKTKETKQDYESRREWKFRLTRRLYEQGYERQDIMNLFRFVDWVLELPEDLKQAFRDDLAQYEQERQMPYITSIERMGIEQGRVEGQRSLIDLLLSQKIGQLSQPLDDRISALSSEKLNSLAIALLNFSTLEDLESWLQEN
jgi:hypothetical protein